MSESSNVQQRTIKDRDLTFWNEQWLANKIGFHRLTVNKYVSIIINLSLFALYLRHFKNYVLSKITSLEQQQCVLFPLCGKTVDMKAVLDAKHKVIGIECVQLGVEGFFEEHNIEHDIEDDENNKCQIYKVDMKIIS
jgi:thiopurine S-methyltransferase